MAELWRMLSLSHKKLEVYTQTIRFTKLIYEITAEFPRSEQFGLSSQIRRAAVSVLSNIAEGSSRYTSKEKVRFYEIARASLVELDSQLELSCELSYCTENQINIVSPLCNRIFALLSGLIKKHTKS